MKRFYFPFSLCYAFLSQIFGFIAKKTFENQIDAFDLNDLLRQMCCFFLREMDEEEAEYNFYFDFDDSK